MLLTLRYAVPTLFTAEGLAGALTLASGLALGGGAVALALKARAAAVLFAVYLVAFQAGLTAFLDLWTLIGLSAGRDAAHAATDARAMADLIPLPAVVWAAAWALVAALLLALALRAAWRDGAERGRRRKVPGTARA